ncbi:Protein-lysine N-methyltransferase rrg1 [Coniothyrium glycines]
MEPLNVLDLPQLYTKPSADALLHTLDLLAVAPPSWERNPTQIDIADSTEPTIQINPEGVTRYLTSIVSSSLIWIEDEDAKEEILNRASVRLSERSGRTAMGAISRRFRIPTSSSSFDLDIHEPALTGDDLGLKTWAASYLLAKRLHTFDLTSTTRECGEKILELGAGTGLVGLAMAGLGADVVLTDLPSICPNLNRNAQQNSALVQNRGGSVQTAVLDWMKPTIYEPFPPPSTAPDSQVSKTRYPLILAADSLYSPDHPRMLVNTINVWLGNEAHAKVIVEFPYRDAYLPQIQDFRQRMTEIGLQILEEGEEEGFDDWGHSGTQQHSDDDALVKCWWSIWTRKSFNIT